MNGFQSGGRGMSSQDTARTTGKKMANSNDGNTTGQRFRGRRSVALRAVRRVMSVLVAVAAALLLAAPALADCGGVKHGHPQKHVLPGRPPLVIGDSVLLGAVPEVAGVGYEVDTRGCRQMSEGLRVLAARRAR